MRKNWIASLVTITLSLLVGEALRAADCGCQQPVCGCDAGGSGGCYGAGGYDPCDPCADGCRGLFCRHRNRGPRYEGLESGFNCGCNGSYKFPVPPLYTYHWPGMWSAQLMTDYHSPWRFPPLKPYVEEVPMPIGMNGSGYSLSPVSATMPVLTHDGAEHTAFSRHLELMSR